MSEKEQVLVLTRVVPPSNSEDLRQTFSHVYFGNPRKATPLPLKDRSLWLRRKLTISRRVLPAYTQSKKQRNHAKEGGFVWCAPTQKWQLGDCTRHLNRKVFESVYAQYPQ